MMIMAPTATAAAAAATLWLDTQKESSKKGESVFFSFLFFWTVCDGARDEGG